MTSWHFVIEKVDNVKHVIDPPSFLTASAETETIKKQYTKILDAYGCLGVLSLNVGGKYFGIFSKM